VDSVIFLGDGGVINLLEGINEEKLVNLLVLGKIKVNDTIGNCKLNTIFFYYFRSRAITYNEIL
jgi:hypothetical protein